MGIARPMHGKAVFRPAIAFANFPAQSSRDLCSSLQPRLLLAWQSPVAHYGDSGVNGVFRGIGFLVG